MAKQRSKGPSKKIIKREKTNNSGGRGKEKRGK